MVETTSLGVPCGGVELLRVGFQHLIRGGGSSSSNRSPRPVGKFVVNSFVKWNLLDESYSTAVLRAIVICTRQVFTSL